MKLRVKDITAETRELSFAEPEAGLNRILDQGPPREFRLEGPISVTLSYYRAGTNIFLSGGLRALTRAVCARCAEEFATPHERSFQFVLTPQAIGYGEAAGLRGEDLELSVYEGDEIDLAPLVREQMLLSLPTHPLCAEQCRGLCPRCGANLNHARCGCAAEGPDASLGVRRTPKLDRA